MSSPCGATISMARYLSTVEGLPAGVTASKLDYHGRPELDDAGAACGRESGGVGWARSASWASRSTRWQRSRPRRARSFDPMADGREQSPDSRLSRDLWLSVIDRDTAPVLVELGEDKTWEMSRAGKLEIPVKVTRRGDMKQPVTLTAIGLPANVKAAPVTVAPEASEGKLVLEIADKAAPGLQNLRCKSRPASLTVAIRRSGRSGRRGTKGNRSFGRRTNRRVASGGTGTAWPPTRRPRIRRRGQASHRAGAWPKAQKLAAATEAVKTATAESHASATRLRQGFDESGVGASQRSREQSRQRSERKLQTATAATRRPKNPRMTPLQSPQATAAEKAAT